MPIQDLNFFSFIHSLVLEEGTVGAKVGDGDLVILLFLNLTMFAAESSIVNLDGACWIPSNDDYIFCDVIGRQSGGEGY